MLHINMKPFLSVVIPVYNEVMRLENIAHVREYLKRQDFSSELIIVDDGSGEQTKKALKTLQQAYHFRLVGYKDNRGKGYAIKQGMNSATGEFRLFTDLDLSTPIEEFNKFLPLLDKKTIVVGSRKMKGANVIVHQSFLRENMGKVFTFLSQTILRLSISDFTCGFKCFSEEAAKKIFSRMSIERWGFDSEILFLGQKYGFSIREVPVVWENEPNTRVKFPRDAIISFSELLQIRWNSLKGKYSA